MELRTTWIHSGRERLQRKSEIQFQEIDSSKSYRCPLKSLSSRAGGVGRARAEVRLFWPQLMSGTLETVGIKPKAEGQGSFMCWGSLGTAV